MRAGQMKYITEIECDLDLECKYPDFILNYVSQLVVPILVAFMRLHDVLPKIIYWLFKTEKQS